VTITISNGVLACAISRRASGVGRPVPDLDLGRRDFHAVQIPGGRPDRRAGGGSILPGIVRLFVFSTPPLVTADLNAGTAEVVNLRTNWRRPFHLRGAVRLLGC
jgi:hypothetical protein